MKTMPFNAQPIWDARLRGQKPADLVFISMVGKLNAENHTVQVKPDADPAHYEWRWVRDLSVCLVYGNAVSPTLVTRMVTEIIQHLPRHTTSPALRNQGEMATWNVDTQAGSRWDYWGGITLPAIVRSQYGLENMSPVLEQHRMLSFENRAWSGLNRFEEVDYV